MGILARTLPWVIMFSASAVSAADSPSVGVPEPASGYHAARDTVQMAVPATGVVRGIYKAYLLAKANEPTFQIAKAEREVGMVSASVARSAYYPQLQYTQSKLDVETQTRTTVQLAQPLIALDRWATFREAPHREALSDSTFDQRDQELAGRILKIVSDLVRYSENLRSNQSRVAALNLQYEGAQRMLQLGQGTVTDVGDTRVRLGQAKADGLNLEAKLEEARRLYAHTCGELPQLAELKLVRRARGLMDLDSLADVKDSNAQVSSAKQNVELAELGTLKAKSAAVPSVLGVATRSEAAGVSTSYLGVSISFPLQAQGLYGISSARANERKVREQLRETEQKVQLDLERLRALIKSGTIETSVRLETIEAAEVNVVANEKSFKGGVRSKADVLNAIQQLYQANDEYVTAMLTLAENTMNYLLAANVRTDTALELVNATLFQ